jgi:formamidopyrimidine-DNA glycosylase
MPELPEVETVRRGLEPAMTGRRILRAEVHRPDLRFPLPQRMAERLTGVRVEGLRRRSKYILADLSSGETLLIHLGMSGRMLISGEDEATMPGAFAHAQTLPAKHDHVVLHVEGGTRITFNDARRFGMMDLFATGSETTHPLLRAIGPEPFGNDFSEDYLVARLAGRATSLKAALLDQHVVAGLGNIYACEVLFRAGLNPATPLCDIPSARLAALAPLIREILSEAIEAGGSSLRDYRQADGELGYFQHSFRVYGREGEPCVTPGCGGTVARMVQSGRSTFYCPHCQR